MLFKNLANSRQEIVSSQQKNKVVSEIWPASRLRPPLVGGVPARRQAGRGTSITGFLFREAVTFGRGASQDMPFPDASHIGRNPQAKSRKNNKRLEKGRPGPSMFRYDYNRLTQDTLFLPAIKSGRPLSHFLGSNSRLLCKSLSLFIFVKILKFVNDRVVMRAYDDNSDSASKMQLKVCWGRNLGSEFGQRQFKLILAHVGLRTIHIQ